MKVARLVPLRSTHKTVELLLFYRGLRHCCALKCAIAVHYRAQLAPIDSPAGASLLPKRATASYIL